MTANKKVNGKAATPVAKAVPAATTYTKGYTYPYEYGGYSKHNCSHRGEAVRVGEYEVYAGGTRYLEAGDFDGIDIVVPLTNDLPRLELGQWVALLPMMLRDYGGVPANWEELLLEQVIPELEAGKTMLAYCMGSHGRTGVFLASLIALLESEKETPDPIAAVRERHCKHAVESYAQAEGIFALRGQELPDKYRKEFRPVVKTYPAAKPYVKPAAKTGWKKPKTQGVSQAGNLPEKVWKALDKAGLIEKVNFDVGTDGSLYYVKIGDIKLIVKALTAGKLVIHEDYVVDQLGVFRFATSDPDALPEVVWTALREAKLEEGLHYRVESYNEVDPCEVTDIDLVHNALTAAGLVEDKDFVRDQYGYFSFTFADSGTLPEEVQIALDNYKLKEGLNYELSQQGVILPYDAVDIESIYDALTAVHLVEDLDFVLDPDGSFSFTIDDSGSLTEEVQTALDNAGLEIRLDYRVGPNGELCYVQTIDINRIYDALTAAGLVKNRDFILDQDGTFKFFVADSGELLDEVIEVPDEVRDALDNAKLVQDINYTVDINGQVFHCLEDDIKLIFDALEAAGMVEYKDFVIDLDGSFKFLVRNTDDTPTAASLKILVHKAYEMDLLEDGRIDIVDLNSLGFGLDNCGNLFWLLNNEIVEANFKSKRLDEKLQPDICELDDSTKQRLHQLAIELPLTDEGTVDEHGLKELGLCLDDFGNLTCNQTGLVVEAGYAEPSQINMAI